MISKHLQSLPSIFTFLRIAIYLILILIHPSFIIQPTYSWLLIQSHNVTLNINTSLFTINDTLNATVDLRPSGRRGHSAVKINDYEMLIFGGRLIQSILISGYNGTSVNGTNSTTAASNTTAAVISPFLYDNNTAYNNSLTVCNTLLYSCNNHGQCQHSIPEISTNLYNQSIAPMILSSAATNLSVNISASSNMTSDWNSSVYNGIWIYSQCICNTGYKGHTCEYQQKEEFFSDLWSYHLVTKLWKLCVE